MPKMPTSVGERIRLLREARGLSQTHLARRAQLSRQTISRIEGGQVQPSVRAIQQIANSLEVRSEELLIVSSAGPSLDLRETPVGSHFGSILKELMARKGLSVAALAKRVGLTHRTIRDYLAKARLPRLDILQNLAEVLEVDPREFLVPMESAREVTTKGTHAVTAPDFDIQFAPDFSPPEVKGILTALANYYRACGGLGFELELQSEEALVKEPVHV